MPEDFHDRDELLEASLHAIPLAALKALSA
jgi:hypothetical protein